MDWVRPLSRERGATAHDTQFSGCSGMAGHTRSFPDAPDPDGLAVFPVSELGALGDPRCVVLPKVGGLSARRVGGADGYQVSS